MVNASLCLQISIAELFFNISPGLPVIRKSSSRWVSKASYSDQGYWDMELVEVFFPGLVPPSHVPGRNRIVFHPY